MELAARGSIGNTCAFYCIRKKICVPIGCSSQSPHSALPPASMLITINVVNAFCPVGAIVCGIGCTGQRQLGTGYRVRHGKYYRRNLGTLSAARCLLYVRVFLFILFLRFLFYLFISFAPRK